MCKVLCLLEVDLSISFIYIHFVAYEHHKLLVLVHALHQSWIDLLGGLSETLYIRDVVDEQ